MAATQQRRKDLEAQQAAYLCAKHEMTQAEIGRLLGGLSQSRVSRLLQRAEECGWLRRTYEFKPDGISSARLEQLKRFLEPSTLVDRLAKIKSQTGVKVRGVHVVDSGSAGTSSRVWDARLTRFGGAASGPLAELMSKSDVCAVTWGKTVSSVVDNSRPGEWKGARGTRFVPVCGEPREYPADADRDTSSNLAERLSDLVRPPQVPPVTVPASLVPPSLTGVPALIGRRYRGTDLRGIRRFVEDAASYREVFGGTSPLIDQVDSLLTAVGPSDHPMGFFFEELLKAGSTAKRKLTKAALQKLVVGDVGGVLIRRPGLNAAGRREVEELNEMWTGATRDHFERIARAAARGSRPGVIVTAIGADDRAEIIAEIIRYGLVNELIIDRTLSDALTRALA